VYSVTSPLYNCGELGDVVWVIVKKRQTVVFTEYYQIHRFVGPAHTVVRGGVNSFAAVVHCKTALYSLLSTTVHSNLVVRTGALVYEYVVDGLVAEAGGPGQRVLSQVRQPLVCTCLYFQNKAHDSVLISFVYGILHCHASDKWVTGPYC
jgi:hypothetical protein